MNHDRIIRAGEEAVRRYMKSQDQILPMARGLLAARRKFPGNQAYGAWLQTSPYAQLGHTDLAALVKLAEHETIVAGFLKTTRLTSPELIWRAVSDQMASSDHRKTCTQSPVGQLVIWKEDHPPQFLRLSIERTEPANESVPPPKLRDLLVADSVREFERFREKYARLPMWTPVFDLFDKVIEKEKKRMAADPTSNHQKPRILQ
jgi:hypothetical protein